MLSYKLINQSTNQLINYRMPLVINAVSRDNKKPTVLRASDLIPAEFYGPEVKNQNVALNYRDFVKVYDEAGESSLVELNLPDGKKYSILIGSTQIHPITGKYIHVDLRQVSLTEKIEANIQLKFIGESPAVKDLGAVFVAAKSEVAIKALPKDLVSEIKVDISSLKNIGDKILMKNIELPAGVEAVLGLDAVIALAAEQEKEEAPVASAAEAEKAAIEAVEKTTVKKETEEEETKEDKK